MASRLVTINPKQLADATALFDNAGKNLPKALQRAITVTLVGSSGGGGAVKMFSDRVKDTINLPVKEIKKQVAVKKPSYTRLVGVISMSHKAVPLIKYMSAAQVRRASQLKINKTGKQTRFRSQRIANSVKVRVRKGGATEIFPESFVERSKKTGKLNIFRRIMGPGGKRVKRYPIKHRMGPTAAGILANAPGEGAATILDEITRDLGPVLQKNVASQMDRLLRNEKSFG